MLKFLNLSHSHDLLKTPDFSRLPNLEKLILEDCTSLVEVHPSIVHLDHLVLLKLRNCKHFRNLPQNICILKSLEILDLSGCSKFEQLPDNLGEMEALTELLVDGTAIRQVPCFIVCLKKLKRLCISGYKGSPSKLLPSVFQFWAYKRREISLLPNSLLGLSSLTDLFLGNCNLSDEAIFPKILEACPLYPLDLGKNNFRSLPASISNLPKLALLHLSRCKRLESLPELPPNLAYLFYQDCTSLERLPNLSRFQQRLPMLHLDGCHQFVELRGVVRLNCDVLLRAAGCDKLLNVEISILSNNFTCIDIIS